MQYDRRRLVCGRDFDSCVGLLTIVNKSSGNHGGIDQLAGGPRPSLGARQSPGLRNQLPQLRQQRLALDILLRVVVFEKSRIVRRVDGFRVEVAQNPVFKELRDVTCPISGLFVHVLTSGLPTIRELHDVEVYICPSPRNRFYSHLEFLAGFCLAHRLQ